MEIYSNSTRFVFSCNQSSKIIEPLQSRCSILRFNKLNDEDVLANLNRIIKGEKIETVTDDGLSALIFTSDGDMRQAVNNLQSVYYGFHMVNSENVFKIVDTPNPLLVRRMLQQALLGDIDGALAVLQGLWGKGYSAVDIVNVCFRVSKTLDIANDTNSSTNSNNKIDHESVLSVLRLVGECQLRLVEGVSTYLQLAALMARLSEISN